MHRTEAPVGDVFHGVIDDVVELVEVVSRPDLVQLLEVIETQDYTSIREKAEQVEVDADLPPRSVAVADRIPYWYPYFERMAGEFGVELTPGEVLVAELLFDRAVHTYGLDEVSSAVMVECLSDDQHFETL